MRAVILAAGRGSRLGSASDGLPKCLLQVRGKPVIFHQLASLAEAGVSPVLMVVGYAADLVRETVGDRAEYVLNARYETTNSLSSFALAADWIREPILVLNSDVLFDPEILERLLKAGPDAVAYDSSSGTAPEHMKVKVRDGIVRNMSKELPKEDSAGENLGLFSLSEASARIVLENARRLSGERSNAFLAEALRASFSEIDLRAVDAAGLPWTEIDTPYDLERARREVWPRIERRSGNGGWKLQRRRRRFLWTAALLALLAGVFAGGILVAPTPDSSSWDTLVAEGGRAVTLSVEGLPQEWKYAKAGESVAAAATGPRELRMDLRLVLPVPTDVRRPFVIEVLLDGKPHDWFKLQSNSSEKATHPDFAIGDREKVYVRIPEGPHMIGVRLKEGHADGLLVRFKAKETAGE